MRVFDRPGPINTSEVIEIVKSASANYNHLVVASITGDSAIKLSEFVNGKEIICVTCPQGMHWEVDQMNEGPFAVSVHGKMGSQDIFERKLSRSERFLSN